MDFPNTKHNNINYSLQQLGDDIVDHDQPFLISFQQEDHIKSDLHEYVSMGDDVRGKSSINTRVSRNRKREGNRASNDNPIAGSREGKDDDQTQKKRVHREIERQRRQQMTKLYATLRDLLPPKFVKGNRSISDHMQQAVHYIKQMEENIKDVSMKRDGLRKPSGPINTVSVEFSEQEIEIMINSCSIQDGFNLSGVLKALLVEGFSITSCTLTQVNNRLLHAVQCEASDLALIDLSTLQQRLFSAANTQTNF